MSSNLSTIQHTKELLSRHGLQPKKQYGQNFLVDKKAVKTLIEAGQIQKNDTVLEIGPGIGVLTKDMAIAAGKVIAVEKDPQMAEILEEELAEAGANNVEIIRQDALEFLEKGGAEGLGEYKAAGNIPFYLTSHLIRILLESKNPPQKTVFIMQKEVAQRIASRPPDMSLLSASVQFYAQPKIAGYVKRTSFWPAPDVDAAVIGITQGKPREGIDRNLFFKILKAGFGQPRKQLINNLSKYLKADKIKVNNWLLKNSIQPVRRAETLSMEDWVNLTKTFDV